MKVIRYNYFSILMLLCPLQLTWANTNLALGKRYELLPKPNYKLCTDPSDVVRLTDGVENGSKWQYKGTVGWQRAKKTPYISIDLEKHSYIQSVKIFTIGGGWAGVNYPSKVGILVGKDKNSLCSTGFKIIELSNSNLKKPAIIEFDDINITGRYVTIVLFPNGPYLFLDEIQIWGVYENEKVIDQLEKKEDQYIGIETFVDYVSQYDVCKTAAVNILDTLRINKAGFGDRYPANIELELNRVIGSLSGSVVKDIEAIKSVEKQLLDFKVGIYQAFYKKPYACLPGNPLIEMNQSSLILSKEKDAFNIYSWNNEKEVVALNLVNATRKPLEFDLQVTPLINDEGRVNQSVQVQIKEALYVQTNKAGIIADPLKSVSPYRSVEVPGGCAKELWIEIETKSSLPGFYHAEIHLFPKSIGYPGWTGQIVLNVFDKAMPDPVDMYTLNWAYPKLNDLTANHLEETIEDLLSHHTNVFVIPPQSMVYSDIYPQVKGGIKLQEFDSYLKAIKDCKLILFFLRIDKEFKDSDRFGRWQDGSWNENYRIWLLKFVEHIKHLGIDYHQFAFYISDEYIGQEFLKVATITKAIDPNINIFANFIGGKSESDFLKAKDIVDIWCIAEGQANKYPERFKSLIDSGKPVWSYYSGQRAMPPSCYRASIWKAFKRGQCGVGFWTYIDSRSPNDWDETNRPNGYYGIVYPNIFQDNIQEGKILSSRRWEMWREGVEDYQYLYELKQLADRYSTSNFSLSVRLRKLLDDSIQQVLDHQNDITIYNTTKKVISEALVLEYN